MAQNGSYGYEKYLYQNVVCMYANGRLLKTSDPPYILDYTLETKLCYVSARS